MSNDTKHSGPVDVLAVLDAEIKSLPVMASMMRGKADPEEAVRRMTAARAAVAELIEADREHDAARIALIDLNRHIADKGWIDVEFDALRNAGDRFVAAQIRRDRALANVGSAS